jgi:hypothetical protein
MDRAFQFETERQLSSSLRPLRKTDAHRLQERPNKPHNLIQVRHVFSPATRHMFDGLTPFEWGAFDLLPFELHPDNKVLDKRGVSAFHRHLVGDRQVFSRSMPGPRDQLHLG